MFSKLKLHSPFINNIGLFSLFLLFVISILYISFIYQSAVGFSLPFSRQEISDPPNDAQLLTKVYNHFNSANNYTACQIAYSQYNLPSPPDIGEVDYLSDGKFLNATFWLNSAFETPLSLMQSMSNFPQTNSTTNENLLTIGMANLPTKNTTLFDYATNHINSLKQTLHGIHIISQEHSIFAGNPAYIINYDYKKNNENLKANKIWLNNKDKIYTITFIAQAAQYSSYFSIFQKMANSFNILSDKNPSNITKDNFLIYKNLTMGIKINYPENWKEQQLNIDNQNHLIAFFAPVKDQFFKSGRMFVMDMDVNTPYDLTGTDYRVIIWWNPSSETWVKEVDEIRSSTGNNNIINKGDSKILEINNNYTGFFEKGKNYADMFANLSKLGNPDQYNLAFYVVDDYYGKNSSCNLFDISDRVHVPPPEFNITTIPNSVVLRQGEEKNIELQIKNINAKLSANITLSTNLTKGMNIKFIPDIVSIPPYGLTTSLMTIKSTNNATIRPYSFPIVANITFPTSRTNYLSNEILNNSVSANIVTRSVLTVDLLESIPFEQQVHNFLTSWFNPITGAYTTILTIVTGILGWRIWKKKGKEKS